MGILIRYMAAALLLAVMPAAGQVTGLRLVTTLDTLAGGSSDTCHASAFKCAIVGSTEYRVNDTAPPSVFAADELNYRWRLLYPGTTVSVEDMTGDDVVTFKGIEDGDYILKVTVEDSLGLDSALSHIDSLPVVINTSRRYLRGNSWQMISLQRNPADSLAFAIFSGLDFLLFRWHEAPGTDPGNYIDYTSRALHQGRAYWVKVTDAVELLLDSSTVRNTGTYSIQLEEGWNQIANPYGYEVLWNNAYFILPEGNAPVTVEASTRDPKPQGIWKWDPDIQNYIRYNPEDTLAVMEMWEGYWVYSQEAIKILFKSIPHFPADSVMRTGVFKAGAAGSGWKFSLRASQGGLSDPSNYCGAAADALTGRDRYDCPEPPSPEPGFSLTLGDGFCEDYQPAAEVVTWQAKISGAADGPVSVGAAGLERLPAGYRVHLFDPAAGTWSALGGEEAARVEGNGTVYVVASRSDELPVEAIGTGLAIRGVAPAPAAAYARVSLQLPVTALGEAPVMTVYGMDGRPAATVTGTVLGAELSWDIPEWTGSGIYPFIVRVGGHRAAGRIIVRR